MNKVQKQSRVRLTAELLARLVAAFEGEKTRAEVLAEVPEVSRASLYAWIKRGRAEQQGPYQELAMAAEIEISALRRRRARAGAQRSRRRRRAAN